MIVNKQIIEYDEIKHRKQDELLLIIRGSFTTTNISLQTNDLDGWYIVYDIFCSAFIRRGAVEAGLWKRWKEHRIASLGTSTVT